MDIFGGLKTLEAKSEIYVHILEAKDIIERCADKNIGILGFEGFYYIDGNIKPDLNLIADFSKIYNTPNPKDQFIETSHTNSLKILNSFPVSDRLYINFTFSEG